MLQAEGVKVWSGILLTVVTLSLCGLLVVFMSDAREANRSLKAEYASLQKKRDEDAKLAKQETEGKLKTWQTYMQIGQVLNKMNDRLTNLEVGQDDLRKQVGEIKDSLRRDKDE